MPLDVLVSNPELPNPVPPTTLLSLVEMIRAELDGVAAPTMPTLSARREALRTLARTKTAIAIAKKSSSNPVTLSDSDFTNAPDSQPYDGYVFSFSAADCGPSVDTGSDAWDLGLTGCAFPIRADADADGDTSEEGEEGGGDTEVDAEAADAQSAGAQFYLSIFDTAEREAHIRTCAVSLPRTREFEPAGVALLFAHTRSQILDVRSVGLLENDLIATPPPRDGARFLAWHGTSCCAEVTFQIRFVGDNPFVRAHTWLAPEDTDAAIPCVEPARQDDCEPRRPKTPKVARLSDAPALASYARTRQQDHTLRRQLVEGADRSSAERAKIARYQAFWMQFDAASNPQLMAESGAAASAETAALIADIHIIGAYLQSSYIDRAQRIAEGLSARDGNPLLGYAATRLRAVAEFTKQQFQAPIGNTPPLSHDELVEAFELFAGGQLTVFEAHGAPNGVNYFCFAELAIRVLEVEDDEFWKPLVRVFARTAELFANCYHMPGAQRRACAYGVPYNPTGARGYSASERTALAIHWSEFSLDQLIEEFGKIVAAALADELEWQPAYRRNAIVDLLQDHH